MTHLRALDLSMHVNVVAWALRRVRRSVRYRGRIHTLH